MEKKMNMPGVLFEVSWEVCNKVGGIHTVLSTKVPSLLRQYNNPYILIGPDVWRDEAQNPEFEPDPDLFRDWQDQFQKKAFAVKTGRWNIEGHPQVILIDFYPLIGKKDEIFSTLWEQYQLDSISGQWDYIEPALFGYAAGQVIEDLCNFYQQFQQRALAQFHEWMTGGGVLYLKENAPQVGTVFTTHATTLGRSIAGNNRPLYGQMTEYQPQRTAQEFGIASKQSLERLTAQHADGFATVSDITAQECVHFLGKKPNVITPNGFEDAFVPAESERMEKRTKARERLIATVRAMGLEISDDALLVATSGRYEFRNKGIDLFLESLNRINDQGGARDIVGFILVPAGISGPRVDLSDTGPARELDQVEDLKYLTHYLVDPTGDPVLNYCKNKGLDNSGNVKVIFVPSYLNGEDGVFNMPYYDLLVGFDVTVFPSYYEPWGYTPLESLAFHIPTITTTLAGFGKWVNTYFKEQGHGIHVLKRLDDNFEQVAIQMADALVEYAGLSLDEMNRARTQAHEISKIAVWDQLIRHYFELFDIALTGSQKRYAAFEWPQPGERTYIPPVETAGEAPLWRKLFVESNVPEELSFLKTLSKNLWWSWNNDAIRLWELIDASLWHECGHNPIEMLENVNYKRLMVLSKDQPFMTQFQRVREQFQAYMEESLEGTKPQIAYFSMEYGLHDSLKIYSGGLGVLAGDFLKEASDSKVHIVAVGLLYRYGYFKQILTLNGEQTAVYNPEHFSKIPAFPVKDKTGNWITITIVFPGRNVVAYLWKVHVGRVTLYLLDTDHEENQPHDRYITHSLYGGDLENRLKQEILLGIGGIRALHKLDLNPDIYHSNEGHSAFIGVERLRHFIREQNLTFDESLELVRSSTLFTTHTPVPAGHDLFPEDLLRTYMSHYPDRLGISWDQFMQMGKSRRDDASAKFNMSFLAANLSMDINGVSKLHGQVSQKIFMHLWPGYLPDELHIGYVTNGVHYKTWAANEWIDLYTRLAGKPWGEGMASKDDWVRIRSVDSREIWDLKQSLKKRMIESIKERLKETWTKRKESPKYIVEIGEKFNEKALTIGFARRFATYKRAHLLFKNLDRLAEIVNHPKRPVQFIFAGKAHPNDKAGQDMIRDIVNISKRPEFLGKILFLQNYNTTLARKLVQGVDVWLNTPTRPLEASGTSGEKAVMNGTLHFSVLDGWWVEGYRPNAGWAITGKRTYANQDFQDELDAETIYHTLESEIIPMYYQRNKNGVAEAWVDIMKNSMADVAPEFTMSRMINDYQSKYYHRLFQRYQELAKDQYYLARFIASWKKRIRQNWDQLEVVSLNLPGENMNGYVSGKEYIGEIIIDLKDLDPEDIGIELVISRDSDESAELFHKQEFQLKKYKDNQALYVTRIIPTYSGGFSFGFRVYPKNPLLPHRQDFPLVRWI
jgi:phosphorylase/glycogen(starch) synthase